ncbi:MAG: HAD-IB family phosphatase [Thermoplasmata archaeon]|nr:HAD-IB family phosphatase [Thermoplasmata archaeon]MCI4356071.1 HAD-IB family phosphatase [Thermoplasmata archaeon]
MLRLVAFDMDGTLVDAKSSWAAIHAHFGDHNDEGLRLFNAGQIDDHEFLRRDIAVWWRHRPDLTIDELEAILDRVPLMPGARPLLEALRGAHVTTAIVSGGIDVLARRVARELGMDLALANGFRVTAQGTLTGEGIIRVPIRNKEAVVRKLQDDLGILPEETASVGNSEIDVGMFRRSAIGVAFLPEDDVVRQGATNVVEEKDLARLIPILLPASGGKSASPPS